MTADELIAAVERALGPLSASYRSGAAPEDLYEAALLSLAVEAAEAAGGDCLLTNDGNSRAAELRFRRAPGNLWRGNFTFCLVTFPTSPKQLEIHLGIYVLGGSGVAHECDIALLDSDEGERSRWAHVHPRKRGLIASIEAKHYVASPGLDIGRGFIGLSAELGQQKCALAFPARSSTNLATLIARRPSECFDELTLESAAAARLRSHLDQAIRNWRA